MEQVGTVQEIWRFPVKSMQGDTLAEAALTPQGIPGDRAWAMRDERRGEIQWGKRHPELMLCSARFRDEPAAGAVPAVEITFPDGAVLSSDDPAVHGKLSALVGVEATLQSLRPASEAAFYKRYKPDAEQFAQEAADWFAREPGEPLPDMSQFPEVLMDHVAVPGTFFDNEAIHLVTTASIRHMQSVNGEANWDIRRFRPNFYIDTPALAGLAEFDWVGRTLRVGDAELAISAPTVRCGMTVRPQGDIEYDKSILRTIVREGEQCLGVGGHVRRPGRVRAGDAVLLED
jgi:uncharacterized protein YcbX